MKVKKFLIAGVVVWLVESIAGWLTCGWLFNWVYMLPPVSLWKSAEEMMSAANFFGSSVLGFLRAMAFTAVYAWAFKVFPGKGIQKGVNYGLMVWVVGALFGIASMPFYMNINNVVVVYWIGQALVMNLIQGMIVGKVYR